MAKPGPKSVGPSAKGSSPSGVVAGNPGRSLPAKPFAKGGKGLPASMKKALKK